MSFYLTLGAFSFFKLASSSMSFRSSPLTRFGISTCTLTSWSPLMFLLFRTGTPFFAMTSVVPGWVPDGILRSTMPSTVGTFIVVPRIASMYETLHVYRMFVSSLLRTGSGRTSIVTKRSPGGPPLRPAFPSDRTLRRLPESTPAGTFKLIRFDFRTRPSPPHVLQGVEVSPSPLQEEHVMTCWKTPRGVRVEATTWPWPPQVLHLEGVVPGLAPEPLQVEQLSRRVISISFSIPNTASLKFRMRL